MITEVEITNFQGHKYTYLDFCSGLNIIKGRTHSGKSSIIRSFEWAFENRPRGAGDKYRRDFSDQTEDVSVNVAFSEGTFISRVKNNKDNIYLSSEHIEPFRSLKTDIPDEIREITKLRRHNIQTQRDKYFIIDKSPGQVATELNKVVGLQIIDEKAAKAKKAVNALINRSQVLSDEIEATKNKISDKKFKTAKSINLKLSRIDYLIDKSGSESEEYEYILEIYDLIHQNKDIINKFKGIEKLKTSISKVDNLYLSANKKESELASIEGIKSAIAEHKRYKHEAGLLLSINPIVLKLNGLLSVSKSKCNEIDELNMKKGIIATNYVDIKRYDCELIELRKKMANLEKKLDYCPRCGAHKKYWREQ